MKRLDSDFNRWLSLLLEYLKTTDPSTYRRVRIGIRTHNKKVAYVIKSSYEYYRLFGLIKSIDCLKELWTDLIQEER